jgi:hypothetical protein
MGSCPVCSGDCQEAHSGAGRPDYEARRAEWYAREFGRVVMRLSDKTVHSDDGGVIHLASPECEFSAGRYIATVFNESGYSFGHIDLVGLLREVSTNEEITAWLASQGITIKLKEPQP